MVAVFRPAYSVRIWLRTTYPASDVGARGAPYVLLNSAAQTPFVQREWSLPGRRSVLAAQGWTNPFPLLLYGKDQFFAAPGQAPRYDQPNPRLALRQPPGFTANTLPLLFMQDVFFGPGGMVPDFDEPNPVLRRTVQQPQLQPNLLPLTVAQAAPFTQGPFANAALRGRAPQFDLSGMPLAILAQAATPFRTPDWPAQRPRPSPAGLDAQPGNVTLLLDASTYATPAQPDQWQPQALRRAVDLSFTPPNLVLLTTVAVASPFAPAAFDTPRRARGPLLDFSSRNLALYSAVQAPFIPQDFSNPIRRAAMPMGSVGGRTLDPQPPFTPATFDTPVRRWRPPVDLAGRNLALYAAIGPMPFRQLDWPNPIRRYFNYSTPWSALFLPSEIPEPSFWTRVPETSEGWSRVAATAETWAPVAATTETWTRVN